MTDPLPASQWGMMACLLSMDAVRPLHKEMGLEWPDRDAFILALRQLILENRLEYQADPTHSPPLGKKLVRLVADLFSERQSQVFLNWAQNVFKQVHADQPDWSGWHLAFFRWVFGQKNNDLLAISRSRGLIESRFRELADTAPLEEKIQAIKTEPLSDWDLEMCTMHGFDPSNDSADFFDAIIATFEICATQLFFGEVLPKLDERDRRWLHSEGQRLLSNMKVWMPGPLPTLDEMVRRLS